LGQREKGGAVGLGLGAWGETYNYHDEDVAIEGYSGYTKRCEADDDHGECQLHDPEGDEVLGVEGDVFPPGHAGCSVLVGAVHNDGRGKSGLVSNWDTRIAEILKRPTSKRNKRQSKRGCPVAAETAIKQDLYIATHRKALVLA
jgi:hypothetical protein